MSFISVIVPTRNRANMVRSALDALDSQTYPDFEVIVVDDASDDQTPAILAAWAGEGRTALRLDVSGGSYGARNLGWQRARGEIVAFTDDDCLPEPGWLQSLERALRDPEVVGAQGVTLARPGKITPFTHQIEQRRPGPPYRTCNIAYRRSLLERLGGFEPMRWYADNIFGLRARQHGAIAFAPDALVLHPPRPRGWRDRAAWLARFKADVTHRRWLRELDQERVVLGDAGLSITLWVLRPLAKQSIAHARYFLRHPLAYLDQVRPMLREKRELVAALRSRGSNSGSAAASLPSIGAVPLVSVIVVTCDRSDSLCLTLDALANQTYSHREVVVVDHSRQGSARSVAERAGARWIAAHGTLASARQRGVEAASGQIVAFTDDDCLPDARWVASLVRVFSSRPDIWGVQGRTQAESGGIGDHAVAVSGPDSLYRTCNIAYRRDALKAVGGFDERFARYFEDAALGARIVEHGEVVFEPSALVVHRAMPRTVLDPNAWRLVLSDERLLAVSYPDFYRRARGRGFVSAVMMRWVLGSPLKALCRELPRALDDPASYRNLVLALFQERLELLRVLAEMLLRPPSVASVPSEPSTLSTPSAVAHE